jgi:long-chain fatty acid transport protein
MNRTCTSIIAFLSMVIAFAAVPYARAGGFQSRELPARAIGMANVLLAIPNEVTAMYVNPAALSFLSHTHLSLGTTLTFPDYTFTGVSPSTQSTRMKSQASYPPNACLAHAFNNGVGIGISVTNPYAARTDWGEEWVGNSIVTSSELRSVQVTPSGSIRIGEHWSLGLGVQVVFLRMDLNRRHGPSYASTIPMVYMTGSADVTYGFEIGVMYVPDDVWRMGLALKSRTRSNIEQGTVTYSGVPGESGTIVMPNATFMSSVTLPDQIRAGVSVQPVRALLLAGEVGFARWSTFKNLMVRIGAPVYVQRFEQYGWKDAFSVRGGIELALDDLRVRAGIAYEESPIPDSQLRPSLPDAHSIVYAAGIGYAIEGGLMLDLGVQMLRHKQRTITDSQVFYLPLSFENPGGYFNGTYDLSSTVVGLSVRYSWK